MRTHSEPLYDNSLIGVMTRLTHGILFDANARAEQGSARAFAPAKPSAKRSSWLDRLDNWFWKQEMKSREAFLAKSIDIFDLEQRMRCLERGDKWLGTDSIGRA
jgi:Protein of unknown function (DUF3563)